MMGRVIRAQGAAAGRPLRIAVEGSTWVNPRGYGRFTRELTRALLRVGGHHHFTIVLDSGAAERGLDLPTAARLTVATSRAVVDGASAEGARSLRDVLRMSRALSSRRFDVVLFPASYSFVPVAPGPAVAVVIHDALPESMPELVLGSGRARLFWKLKSHLACRRANIVATVSESSAREIRRHLPVGTRPLTVLTEGIAEIFSNQPQSEDLDLVDRCVPGGGRIVLYVGGLSPHKRVPDLIRAFTRVAGRPENQDLRLVLAGPDKSDGFLADREAVSRAINDSGAVARRIVRPGFVSDATLAALYRAAVCLVLPSAAEGFGLPALEAMASGTPVVAARAPALREVCADAAEYIDDASPMAEVIGRLASDSKRREELSRLGVERARRFSWNEAATRMLAAIEALSSTRRIAAC